MADENTKKNIFTKEVFEKSKADKTKKVVSLILSPWSSVEMDGYKQGDKIYSGYTCQIEVVKLGRNPKQSSINIDPASEEVRKAISEMYTAYDKIVGTKQ